MTHRTFESNVKWLRGGPVADHLKANIYQEVAAYQAQGVTPRLATLLVEGAPASTYYARQKVRVGRKLGVHIDLIEYTADVSEATLIRAVEGLSQNPEIHGVMIELPLPNHVAAPNIIACIDPRKDIDGLTDTNRIANISGAPGIYPATPLACLALLEFYRIALKGKHVVLIGCGQTVGSPLFHALIRAGATVTVCTEHTADLGAHLRRAEIAITAVGCANLVTPEMVHDGLVLVDAGMSELPNGEMAGDVDPAVIHYAAALTPTPGGVGRVTTVQVFQNLLHAMSLQQVAPTRPAVSQAVRAVPLSLSAEETHRRSAIQR